MEISTLVKRLQDIMRNDSGMNGDAQRIEQLVWMLFLKVYDVKEEVWELRDNRYISILPKEYRWRNWAKDKKDGCALTDQALLHFINSQLFPYFKSMEADKTTSTNKTIVKTAFEDAHNYMKDGILLRQVINVIDEINFDSYDNLHAFGDIYETILKNLQNAGSSGEFYTPRAVTDFMAQMTAPMLGEKIADFACGTGGFLTSALRILDSQVINAADREQYIHSIYGVEKKSFPHLLCLTNMLLHGINNPAILHENSLAATVQDYAEADKFDLILMNPPYGGRENDDVRINFPPDLRSSETADLFMAVIMFRLKKDGRCAVIFPDGFLFGTDHAKIAIKQKLLFEFNLHTVVRMPHSIFAPYTSITTNILFFDKTRPTTETWFYRLDMPDGYKSFSKTNPVKIEHFEAARKWWNMRTEISVDGFDKAKKYKIQELIDRNYNIDLCGYSRKEEDILPPKDLIQQYQEKRIRLNAEIDCILDDITKILNFDMTEDL